MFHERICMCALCAVHTHEPKAVRPLRNYVKYPHTCLFVYVNTKVKIILHLLLMSDLHAFTNISDADRSLACTNLCGNIDSSGYVSDDGGSGGNSKKKLLLLLQSILYF